ncbi:LEA/WHy family protein [Spirosoma litoris]
MNKKGFILIAAIALIVLWILYKVNTAQRLNFALGVPKQISLQSGALTFIIPVNVTNNSSGSIRVKSADFDVITSGKSIGLALIKDALTIAPKATTVMPVYVTIGALDAISAASTFWASLQAGKINLTLDGVVYAELFQFPVKQSFDLQSDLLKNFTKIF